MRILIVQQLLLQQTRRQILVQLLGLWLGGIMGAAWLPFWVVLVLVLYPRLNYGQRILRQLQIPSVRNLSDLSAEKTCAPRYWRRVEVSGW
jgi:hypothetical protein